MGRVPPTPVAFLKRELSLDTSDQLSGCFHYTMETTESTYRRRLPHHPTAQYSRHLGALTRTTSLLEKGQCGLFEGRVPPTPGSFSKREIIMDTSDDYLLVYSTLWIITEGILYEGLAGGRQSVSNEFVGSV